MDLATKNKCIELTSDFYRQVSTSFSDTRKGAWHGWERVLDSIDVKGDFSLLDVACGNLRFEKFLIEKGCSPKVAVCVDKCAELLPEDVPSFVEFKEKDLLSDKIDSKADLVVSFGFMHHIPSLESRKKFLTSIFECVQKNGYLVLSFWQFLKDERIAKKAFKTTNIATKKYNLLLEENDYLLGWQDRDDVFRFCHTFTDVEIDELLSSMKSDYQLISEFSEDGKSHDLNKYVILKRQ